MNIREQKKRVLLTGGVGFIGHHTVEHFLLNTKWEIIIMDRLSYAGNQNYLVDMKSFKEYGDRVKFVFHDFRAEISETTANLIGELDYIVHMGAESHVDNSIKDPMLFAQSNVIGTVNMLEYFRKYNPKARFIYISTDEVYGPAITGVLNGKRVLDLHTETERHKPSNPYSASKSGAESFCYAYYNTYGLDILITNTMNNFGERQDPEKFVPKVVKALLQGLPVTAHCKMSEVEEDGELKSIVVDVSSRCWLHARNHADGLLFVMEHGQFGESYNITGEWATVEDMINRIARILEVLPTINFEDFHSFRPGHDMHYGLDGTKLAKMGWTPPYSLDDSLKTTIKWMQNNKKWLGL